MVISLSYFICNLILLVFFTDVNDCNVIGYAAFHACTEATISRESNDCLQGRKLRGRCPHVKHRLIMWRFLYLSNPCSILLLILQRKCFHFWFSFKVALIESCSACGTRHNLGAGNTSNKPFYQRRIKTGNSVIHILNHK